jgi:hypothetical protein
VAFRFYSGMTFSHLASFPEDAMVSLATAPRSARGYARRATRESVALATLLDLKSEGRRRVDGAGFSQVFKHGRWLWGPDEHEKRMSAVESGLGAENVDGYFTQDWMCEPVIIQGGHGAHGTGLSVEEHQRRTVQSGVDLERINPRRKWVHTVQGYTLAEYERCIQMYFDVGIDLMQRETVAFGSMCKRGPDAAPIAAALFRLLGGPEGPRKHILGFNILALVALIGMLTPDEQNVLDADSASWSMKAKNGPVLMRGHKHGGKKVAERGYSDADWERLWAGDRFDGERWPNCANCTVFALHERKHILSKVLKRWYWNWSLGGESRHAEPPSRVTLERGAR